MHQLNDRLPGLFLCYVRLLIASSLMSVCMCIGCRKCRAPSSAIPPYSLLSIRSIVKLALSSSDALGEIECDIDVLGLSFVV